MFVGSSAAFILGRPLGGNPTLRIRGGADRASEGAPPPVAARVLRGGRLESAHRARAAAADAKGRVLFALGDGNAGIYIRSAGKPFQALPLLEAGGERAFRLSDDDIALMCASHGGEPRHVRVAARLLRRGGFTARDLACGAHWPMHEPSALRLARRGERPTALHNNCSGKHAGLLLACRAYGFPARGYTLSTHPIQREVLRRISLFCGVPADSIPVAVDGCNLPVFFLPMSALARGYAALLSGAEGKPGTAEAAASRVVGAMTASPGMVAGKDRFTTAFLRAGRGKWIGKEGAEGVYAVGVRVSARSGGSAIGIALKIEDGSTRARDAVTLALLERLDLLPDRARAALSRYRRPAVRNVRGRLGRRDRSGGRSPSWAIIPPAMAYRNLRAFLEVLERDGDLARVRAEVSPRLEISEIADRSVKGGGPALLFENVWGSSMPVAINLFASRRRMLRALELASFEEWDARLEFFLDPKPPEGLLDKLKALPARDGARGGLPEDRPLGRLPGGRRDRRRRRPPASSRS